MMSEKKNQRESEEMREIKKVKKNETSKEKKVKENAAREVKKKEIKKSEGVAANDSLKEIKELIKNQMEELRLEMNAQNEVMKMELKGIKESVMKGVCDEIEKMCAEVKKNMLEEMEKMRGDVMEKVNNLSSEVNKVKEEMKEQKRCVEFISEWFDEMKKDHESIKERVNEKNDVKEANDQMKKEMKLIEWKVNDISNRQQGDNLELYGLPCNSSENCKAIAFSIAKKLDTNIKDGDILDAYRIGNPKNNKGETKKIRPVLIRFRSTVVRNAVYNNRRLLRDLSLVEMGISVDDLKIFLNENLSEGTKSLMRKVTQLRKEKNWKFVWSYFGVIYARKIEGANKIAIRSEEDLQLIV